jgi:hypothetical protein
MWRQTGGAIMCPAGATMSASRAAGCEIRPARRRPGMAMKRTTHRSVSGKKLYAVRDSKGRFKDIQTYKRAHAADMRRKSKAEIKAGK